MPQISVFNKTELMTTYQPEDEDIFDFMDRSIYLATPAAPPRICCPTLIIDNAGPCTGTYNKTTRMNNDRVLYKEVVQINTPWARRFLT